MRKVALIVAIIAFCANAAKAQTASPQLSLSQQIAMSVGSNVILPASTPFGSLTIQQSRLPFFCRQEVLIEQKIKLPLRLRVGTMEQSNFLEQKTSFLNKGF